MKMIAIYPILLILLVSSESKACTAFCLHHSERAVLARNLDWPVDEGQVLINSAGIRRVPLSNGASMQWRALYRSITFTQFGPGLPLGGMNEKGLVVEELNGPPFETRWDLSGFRINELQLIQYLLDCCSSVEEVNMALDTLLVFPDLLPLHYLLMDREGNSLVIEPGTMELEGINPDYFGVPVLSNNAYRESLRYLGMFQGFGGELAVQHRPGSNERFVSVAALLKEQDAERGSWKDPIARAFAILDTVAQEDTRWSLVYEPRDLSVLLRFHSCSGTRMFSLPEILVHSGSDFLALDMARCASRGTGAFHALEADGVTELLQRVGTELWKMLDRPGLQNLFLIWEKYALAFIGRTGHF